MWICTDCGSNLNEWVCGGCERRYHATVGIFDVRPEQLQTDEQVEVTAALLAAYDQADFATLLELFFRVRNVAVPAKLLDHYRNYMDTTLERGGKFATMFLDTCEAQYGALAKRDIVVDIGCGSGAMMLALAGQFEHVVGIDPKLPRLILAKKLLEENGVSNFTLFHGYGQHVPVADGCADFVTAQNVMEHVFDVNSVVGEVHRMLRVGGGYAADSRNRYDLFFKEPHVQIRWVGFMPREWGKRYVKWRTGTVYDSAQLLSVWDCRRELGKWFGRTHTVTFPDVSVYGQPAGVNRVMDHFAAIKPLKAAALTIFPTHLLVAQKR